MSISQAYNGVSCNQLRRRSPLLVILLFWTIAAASVAGAPLKCSDVPANPARLLHIDFDAMRQTYVGEYLLYQLDKPEMHSNMVAFQSIFSFDLRRQLHGMTIYSATSTPNDSVVITYADFEPARLRKLLTGSDGAFRMTNRQHVIYSWIDKKKNRGGPEGGRTYGAILGGRMIAATTRQSINDALAVVDGTASGGSLKEAALEFGDPSVTNFVLASAHNFGFIEPDSKLAPLKLSKSVELEAGELGEILKATLTVKAEDQQTARQISLVAQGLIGALRLHKGNPWASKLADGMGVQPAPDGFRVTISVSSKDVMAALKANMEKDTSSKPGA